MTTRILLYNLSQPVEIEIANFTWLGTNITFDKINLNFTYGNYSMTDAFKTLSDGASSFIDFAADVAGSVLHGAGQVIRAGSEKIGKTVGQTISEFLAPIWPYLLIGVAAVVVLIILLCVCQRTNCCSMSTSKSLAFTTIIHQDKDQVRREAWDLFTQNPSDYGDNLPPPSISR